MELPLYEIFIDEEKDSFVDAVALVDSPAIESNFLAFSTQQENLTFSMDDEKKELLGAAMIPDMQIFRKDSKGQGYNVFFSKNTIRNIAQVFFKKGLQSNINLSHTNIPANSYIFQSYITDESKGMASPKGLELPDGSWVIGIKVNDESIWQEIRAGKMKGFSVEGLFQMAEVEIEQKHQSEETELLDLFQKINSILFKRK